MVDPIKKKETIKTYTFNAGPDIPPKVLKEAENLKNKLEKEHGFEKKPLNKEDQFRGGAYTQTLSFSQITSTSLKEEEFIQSKMEEINKDADDIFGNKTSIVRADFVKTESAKLKKDYLIWAHAYLTNDNLTGSLEKRLNKAKENYNSALNESFLAQEANKKFDKEYGQYDLNKDHTVTREEYIESRVNDLKKLHKEIYRKFIDIKNAS